MHSNVRLELSVRDSELLKLRRAARWIVPSFQLNISKEKAGPMFCVLKLISDVSLLQTIRQIKLQFESRLNSFQRNITEPK